MKLNFIDTPRQMILGIYEQSISRMVSKISKIPGVISIYQIGSVTTPGISDIDIVVVFDDKVTCSINPLNDLQWRDRYLFVHGLFGISISHFDDCQKFTLFHNYNLLWGKTLNCISSAVSCQEKDKLKKQIAMEYLVRMYMNMVLEKSYRVVKLRNLFLISKGIIYDLEFLKIENGKLFNLTEKIIKLRTNWFEQELGQNQINDWFIEYYEELKILLITLLKKEKLFVPEMRNYTISRNMNLIPSQELSYKYTGLLLPKFLKVFGKKYVNLQNRFIEFYFFVPIEVAPENSLLKSRFEFLREMKKKSISHFPHFSPLVSNLNIN